MWTDFIMLLLEFLAAICAVALCGPGLLACARRLIVGDELLQKGHTINEAEVLGCDEPNCPYYKNNVKFLMVPASRKRMYASPTRPCN